METRTFVLTMFVVDIYFLMSSQQWPFSNALERSHYSQAEQAKILDARMEKMVRSIAATNKKLVDLEKKLQRQSEDVVLYEMSAVVQNNSLPNYYIHTPAGGSRELYESGALVFLHHHRSAGKAMISCLEELARNKSLAFSQIMESNERVAWHRQRDNTYVDNNRFDIHRGKFSFGICNDLERNCSHFTILRDPMHRAISSHQYCKEAYGDELCSVGNANDMTLRQWIIHQGSLLFRQLVFLPDWCHLSEGNGNNRSNTPCWYKHKLHFDNIPANVQKDLLNYVLNNLDQWFGAIGMFDDLEHSLKIFEHLYNMPFSKCTHFRNGAFDGAEIFDNRSNRNKKRVEPYSDDDPEYLKYDYEVQQALAADNKIYKKARQIFRVQKQHVSNKIGRRLV